MAIAMQPPFVECVFLGDPPLVHDKTTDEDSIEFELKESRKQAPTISSTTAPGGATREGQSIDAHEAEKKEKLAQLETLAVDAGLIKP
jgi:hypothetical protein